MPKYRITDRETGRTVTVSGPSAPTEQEAEGIFTAAGLRTQQDPGNAITNFIPSLQKNVGDFVSAVTNPIDTAKGMVSLAGGVTDKAGIDTIPAPIKDVLKNAPGPLGQLLTAADTTQDIADKAGVTQEQRGQAVDAVADFYKQRYGGIDNTVNTINQDPAGFLMDASTVLGGVGLLGKGKIANIANKASVATDPIAGPLSLTSKILPKANRLSQPFARSVDQDVVKLGDELGVDLPLSAKTTSPVLRQGEAVAQKGLFGDKIRRQVTSAYQRLEDLSDEVTARVIGDTDLKGTGIAIQKGFDDFKTKFREQKTELYDAVGDDVLKSEASTSRTLEVLDEIIAQKSQSLTGGKNIDFYKRLRNRIAPVEMTETPQSLFPELTAPQQTKPATINQLKATRSEIGAQLKGNDPVVTGDRAMMNRLYSALSDDLDTSIKTISPEAGAALDEANEFYRTNIEKINSALGRKIQNSDPERLVDNLVKPNSETTIESLKEIIGEEAFGQVQEAFFQRVFEKSLNPRTGRIELSRLNKQLDRYGKPTVRKLLTDAQRAKLDGIKTHLEKLDRLEKAMRSGTKPADGSQTAFLAEVGGMIGLTAFNPMLMAKYVVGRVALTQLFGSKTGQNLLMQGLNIGDAGANTLNRLQGPVKAGKVFRLGPNGEQDSRLEGLKRAQERTRNEFKTRPSLLP